MASNSESRKRTEGLWAEPQWRGDEATAGQHGERQRKALAALQRVFPTAEAIDADALLDALADEGLVAS